MTKLGMPNSTSLYLALQQVANEVAQENGNSSRLNRMLLDLADEWEVKARDNRKNYTLVRSEKAWQRAIMYSKCAMQLRKVLKTNGG